MICRNNKDIFFRKFKDLFINVYFDSESNNSSENYALSVAASNTSTI